MLNNKESVLVKYFLEDYSSRLGNDGCNDWDFPKDWSVREKEEFVKHYHAWNGDPEEYNPKRLNLPNFAVVSFLAYKMSKKELGYTIKIKNALEASQSWVLGYLNSEQQNDLIMTAQNYVGPFFINFIYSGTGVIIKVFDQKENQLLDLTDYNSR